MESEDLIKLPRSSSSGESGDDGIPTSGCKRMRSDNGNSEVGKDVENLRIHESTSCIKSEDDTFNEDLDISLPTLPFSVESTVTVPVTVKNSFLSSKRAENGLSTAGEASSGAKRPRMAVDVQQPSVRVVYNSLTRESRNKLEELLQQWSEWHSRHCPSSNDSNEVLEFGEEIYFPALNLGAEKALAVPFCIDDQTMNPANKEFIALDGKTVPLYDRSFSSALTSVDGPNNLKSNSEVLNSSRCFNCGSYSHSLRECPKPRDRVAVDKAKKEHMSRRSQNSSSRNPTRYYEGSPKGKFDGLRPGFLNSETRQLLGLGELDPPPWLNRMRELGYPPGYLDSQDGDQPSGITIFADEEGKEETKGNILEIGSHEPSRKRSPKPHKKMSVEYPGINAPIPESADIMNWKSLTSASDSYHNKYDLPSDSSSKGYDFGTYNGTSLYQDDRRLGSPDLRSFSRRYGFSSDSFRKGHDFGTYNGESDYQDDRRLGSSDLRSFSPRYGISDHLNSPFTDSSARAIPNSSSRYNFYADSINRDYSRVPDRPHGSYVGSSSDRYDSYHNRHFTKSTCNFFGSMEN